MRVENYQMKEEVIRLETAARNSIQRDESDNIKTKCARIEMELVETRAAMLSYKNMYNVIADQAKNLKLIAERKKDEHDNLMNALREMQSEGPNQERLGKLYFVIMLSRWQEASVNKRYDAVIQEVKDLRVELINQTTLAQQEESAHTEAESLVQKISIEKERIKAEVGAAKGGAMSQGQL
jgi:hypothetical protein